MRPVILCRSREFGLSEQEAAVSAGFVCIRNRLRVKEGDVVIGRFYPTAALKELDEDIRALGAWMINSLAQHGFIADLRNWADQLGELTPKTWYRIHEIPEEGPFVLKGRASSRKEHWKTHMFARNRTEAIEVCERLLLDGFITEAATDVYTRQYVPLVTYARGINDLPVTKEFRVFVFRGKILSAGFYWSSWADTCLDADPNWKEPRVEEIPEEFLAEAIRIIGGQAEYYAMDIAQDVTGRWWVIEINDGQMSGLSGNDPNVVYPALRLALG